MIKSMIVSKKITILLLSVVCAVCLFTSVMVPVGRKAFAAESISSVPNGNFEKVSGAMPENWSLWSTSASPDIKFSIVGGSEAFDGNSLKVVNAAKTDIRAVLNSDKFPVEAGKTYLFSFYYKSLSATAVTASCIRQFKGDGENTAANTYCWINAATVSGATGDWRRVTAVYTAEPDAAFGMLQMDIAPTGDSPVYFDDFSLTEVSVDTLNDGFENLSENGVLDGWILSDDRDFSFDNEIYYEGKSSAHVKRENYVSGYTINSIGFSEVLSAKTYEIGFYVRSKSSKSARVYFNISIFNREKNMMQTVQSPYIFLNGNDELSEWTKVWMRTTMPADTAFIRYSITITAGVADCYIDNLFCNNVNDYLYTQDFEKISNTGAVEGFEGGTFANGKLNLSANEKSTLKFDGSLYGYGYTLTGDLEAQSGAKLSAVVDWYDFNGKISESKTYEISTEYHEFSLEFLASKAAYAKITFKNDGKVKISLDNFAIAKTYDPALAATGWEGQWVCYPYSDLAYGGEYATTYFRKEFEIDGPIVSATVQLDGDDIITSFVNGTELEDEGKTSWSSVLVADVTSLLKQGTNAFAFELENKTYFSGLLFDLEVVYESGKKQRVYSDGTTKTTDAAPGGGAWKNAGFNDTAWKNAYIVGPVSCQPWGLLAYKKSADTMPNLTFNEFSVTEEAKSGEYIEFTAKIVTAKEIDFDLDFKVNFRSKYIADEKEAVGAWLTPELISGKKSSQWKVGEENEVKYRVFVPDYLESGSYMFQFENEAFYCDDGMYANNIMRGAYFYIDVANSELSTSKIVRENGFTKLVVDDEAIVPMIFLREENTKFLRKHATGMSDAGVQIIGLPNARNYNMNNAGALWKGENQYDFTAVDDMVYETLEGAPTAMLMLMLDADPPWWWQRKYASQMALDENGKQEPAKPGVSYASEKWRTDAGNFFKAYLEHVMAQPYAGHIMSVKIAAGSTFEWQYYRQTLDTCADFSQPAKEGFKKWLKEKYVTEDALRAAWGNEKVTFETASVPTKEQRKPTVYKTLLDGKTQRNVIDFHEFMCDMTTDSILYLAKVVKDTIQNRWIVGTYNGYITSALTYESAGLVNSSFERLLKSDYLDFFCSPVCYDERQIGMSASYMMMVDSILAAGKLPIIECDSRTVYYNSSNAAPPSTLAEWGKTYTLRDTLEGMKRDFANMMTKGAGLWWYDMNGSWFDDPEIYSLISTMVKEWEYAIAHPSKNASNIAFIIDDAIVTETAYNFDATYDYYYQALYNQKESLGHLGASYDMLYLSDVKDGLEKEYDVYLVVAFSLNKQEREAISKHLKKSGKTIIWVGATGIYGDDGSMTAENVSKVIDMDVTFAPKGTPYGIKIIGNAAFSMGLDGEVYGKPLSTAVDPLFCVTDANAEKLGNFYGTYLTGLASKAVKTDDGGYYFSIYSAVGNVPEGFLRNVLRNYGVKILETENDAVYRNSSYVSIASFYGGKKTVELDKKCDVYDVFKGEWIAFGVKSFTVELEEGEAALYRLGKYEKPAEPDNPNGGKTQSCANCASCKGSVAGSVPAISALALVAFIRLIKRKKGFNR